MNRQIINFQIYELIKDNSVIFSKTPEILQCINDFPHQRFGQIICNYICPDYRSAEISSETLALMTALFPNNPDPFYEESIVTLKRLKDVE